MAGSKARQTNSADAARYLHTSIDPTRDFQRKHADPNYAALELAKVLLPLYWLTVTTDNSPVGSSCESVSDFRSGFLARAGESCQASTENGPRLTAE
jgi:hypothetical protein